MQNIIKDELADIKELAADLAVDSNTLTSEDLQLLNQGNPEPELRYYTTSDKTSSKDLVKQLEENIQLHLLGMNRQERRSWLARQRRAAGKTRAAALTVRKAPVTAKAK
jgi:hypothetical protein